MKKMLAAVALVVACDPAFAQGAAPSRDEKDLKFSRDTYSPIMEVLRPTRTRVSEASYKVGLYYYRARWYPGAIARFKEVLQQDPGYPERDAVYYYLAESLLKSDNKAGAAEARPYYDRLVKEFDHSEYLADARKRLETLGAQ